MRSRLIWVLACAIAALARAQSVPAFTISTYGGTPGTPGYGGDGGDPSLAEFNQPFGLWFAGGTLYIADQVNDRVRSVSGGKTNTVAGTGAAGFSGDSSTAANAELNAPTAVTVDSSGNIYIGDTENNVIRMVSPKGIITTFAGSNSLGRGYNGDGGGAVSAQLSAPSGIVFDRAGNLYIADSGNNVIRIVYGPKGAQPQNNIATFAGNSIADYNGDGGPANAAEMNHPTALLFDPAGNLYIADTLNNCVRVINPQGIISTFAGNTQPGYSGDGGPATQARLFRPSGLAMDAKGNLYIADSFNHVIRVVLPNGMIYTVAGTGGVAGYAGDGGPAVGAQFNYPTGLAFDGSGNLLVSDTNNSLIRQLTPAAAAPTPMVIPTINSAGVSSLQAFGGSASAAPGSWIEIHGANLAAATQQWASSDFQNGVAPTSLAGTSVHLGAQPLFVEYVSPTQINALIPSSIGTGPQSLTVTTAAGNSAVYPITINTAQPGLLASPAFNIGGTQYVVAILPDGSYALPTGVIPGVATRPARAGETVTLYGIGFGPVTPNVPAGRVASGSNQLLLPVQFLFGQASATVSYAGLSPGAVGLYQFNVTVPNVSGSATPLKVAVGSVTGSQLLAIAVQ
ncbi:MAG TPA: hypothetical protein VKX39_05685 [Bryobacteraceae bacterium]|nr:hypothetical protein [Bryobacteraceae bacterium]